MSFTFIAILFYILYKNLKASFGHAADLTDMFPHYVPSLINVFVLCAPMLAVSG